MNNILTICQDCHQNFLKYKRSLMGMAIIFVVCCHSTIIGWHPLALLSPGLIGCDIFMILSGSSLAFSYKSHPLSEFYRRRVARIVPMLLLFALSRCLLDSLSGQDITWKDYIYTAMLFPYFGWGGVEFDWYLTTSLIFYLLYPVLYYQKKYVLTIIIPLAVLIIQMFYTYDSSLLTLHEAVGLARLPMFCWGIYLQRSEKISVNNYLFWFVLFGISTVTHLHFFYIVDMGAPFLLICMYLVIKNIDNKNMLRMSLEWLGGYTLEIYIANMLIYVFIKNFLPSTIGIRVVIYIVGICILSLLLIQISCGFNKMILTKNSRLK